MAKKRALIAGPFIGELGWEVFTFQPVVRARFEFAKYDKCLVYTRPGRQWLYRFAETRTLPNIPKHEPECMAWANFAAYQDDLRQLHDAMIAAAQQELGDRYEIEVMGYQQLGNLGDPKLGAGAPDLLYPDKMPGSFMFKDDGRKKIVLCVRDRGLADHRNWGREKWERLATALMTDFDVVIVGQVDNPSEWSIPDGVRNLLNFTTIDDLIALFSQSDLAVGGSTGTMHLASRCGCDHVVWGAENATVFPLSERYAATNWFGAKCDMHTEKAWEPEPEEIVAWVQESAKWMRPKKARVCVTFDDTYRPSLQAAAYMADRGIHGSFCVVSGRVGEPGFPTWSELTRMQEDGHCLVNHSATHGMIIRDPARGHMQPIGKDGITIDAVAGRDEMVRQGLPGDLYAAPFGTGNVQDQKHLDELAGIFSWVRLTVGTPMGDRWTNQGGNRIYPGDYKGKVIGTTAAADCRWPNRVKQRIDEACRVNGLVVLIYHRVDSVVGENQDVTWQMFRDDMEHLATKVLTGEVEIVTARQLADEADEAKEAK